MPRKLSRRGALVGAGAIIAIPAAGYVGARVLCSREQVAAINPTTLAAVMKSPSQAIMIGKAYVEAQINRPDLIALLDQDAGVAHALKLDCVQSGVARLATLISADFSSQRIEIVNDWILAKTELILCGLIYRLSPSQA